MGGYRTRIQENNRLCGQYVSNGTRRVLRLLQESEFGKGFCWQPTPVSKTRFLENFYVWLSYQYPQSKCPSVLAGECNGIRNNKYIPREVSYLFRLPIGEYDSRRTESVACRKNPEKTYDQKSFNNK